MLRAWAYPNGYYPIINIKREWFTKVVKLLYSS